MSDDFLKKYMESLARKWGSPEVKREILGVEEGEVMSSGAAPTLSPTPAPESATVIQFPSIPVANGKSAPRISPVDVITAAEKDGRNLGDLPAEQKKVLAEYEAKVGAQGNDVRKRVSELFGSVEPPNLEDLRSDLNAKEEWSKDELVKAALMATLPAVVGGLFGGLAGASGASKGGLVGVEMMTRGKAEEAKRKRENAGSEAKRRIDLFKMQNDAAYKRANILMNRANAEMLTLGKITDTTSQLMKYYYGIDADQLFQAPLKEAQVQKMAAEATQMDRRMDIEEKKADLSMQQMAARTQYLADQIDLQKQQGELRHLQVMEQIKGRGEDRELKKFLAEQDRELKKQLFEMDAEIKRMAIASREAMAKEGNQSRETIADKNNETKVTVTKMKPAAGKSGGKGAPRLQITDAQKAVDRNYAKDWNEFTSKGRVNAESSIKKLEAIKRELEKDQGLFESGGGRVSVLPDALRSKDAIRRRDMARNAANATLKSLFGGQLSDGERKSAAEEFYNDKLGNAENAAILGEKILAMKAGLANETAKAEYFRENGTLAGFNAGMSLREFETSPKNNSKPIKHHNRKLNKTRITYPDGRVEILDGIR
jgi:hypothetical protein